MTVTSVNLMREGRGVQQDDKFAITLTRQWRVVTDDEQDNEAIVALQSQAVGPQPVPSIWTPHPGWPTSYLRLLRMSQEGPDDPRRWIVTGEYRPRDTGQEEQDRNENPLARPAKYRLEGEAFTEIVVKDKDDVAIVNAANQEFDEPLEQESTRPVLVAEKNLATLQEIIDFNTSHAGKVNDAAYLGGAIRSWLCKFVTCSEKKNENGIDYYTASFRLTYKPSLWNRVVVNRGVHYYDAVGTENLVQDKDKFGVPIGVPINLAADGTKLGNGVAGNTLTFEIYEEADFDDLPV